MLRAVCRKSLNGYQATCHLLQRAPSSIGCLVSRIVHSSVLQNLSAAVTTNFTAKYLWEELNPIVSAISVLGVLCILRKKLCIYEAGILATRIQLQTEKTFSNRGELMWWDQIEEGIYLGALPLKNLHHHQLISDLGVKTVVSFNESFELKNKTPFSDPVTVSDWKAHEITFIQFPTPDFEAVEMSVLIESIAKLDEVIKRGSVYLHCRAGVGRSAMVLACYLIKAHKFSLDEALTFIIKRRPQVALNAKQYEVCEQYYESQRDLV